MNVLLYIYSWTLFPKRLTLCVTRLTLCEAPISETEGHTTTPRSTPQRGGFLTSAASHVKLKNAGDEAYSLQSLSEKI